MSKKLRLKGLGRVTIKKMFKETTLTKYKFNFSFQEYFGSINKIFNLAGRLGTRLLFYEVLRLYGCFLISHDPKS